MIAAERRDGRGSVRELIEGFEAAGADELILLPGSPDPEQVDLSGGGRRPAVAVTGACAISSQGVEPRREETS